MLLKDTLVLMFDGTIKHIQDISIGDWIMGDDSTSIKVLSIHTHISNLYKICQDKSNAYIVDESHVLCLKNKTQIKNINLQNYNDLYFGYHVAIEFPHKQVEPYIYLPTNISIDYLINTYEIRLQTLAEIIDTIGVCRENYYIINSVQPEILFLARSLGFIAFKNNHKIVVCNNDTNVFIKIIDLQKKDMCYGLELDNNQRFILHDFTVVNSELDKSFTSSSKTT